MPISHDKAVQRARLAASAAGLKVFRREVGLFYDVRGKPHKIGTNGEADLQGWQVSTGRFVAIEVKTGKAKRTKLQTRFMRAVERDGGLYILARYNDEVDGDETIRRAAVDQ